jgi:hypothetical protein
MTVKSVSRCVKRNRPVSGFQCSDMAILTRTSYTLRSDLVFVSID